MFLEGCKWDPINRFLGESDPKVLFQRMVMMWFKPVLKVDRKTKDIYECPLYKTTERKGTLSTTGHSTNFCLLVSLPSSMPQSHWIKRGVALVCSLND
jgi:dynein heavy chain